MNLERSDCRARFASASVARLATVGPEGPHLVPIVFALIENRILSAVDDKPKRSRALTRLVNITADARVSVLADHYSDDWSELWWVRADGAARVIDASALAPADLVLLAGRYPQYAEPPAGPYIEVRVRRWTGWAARPPG